MTKPIHRCWFILAMLLPVSAGAAVVHMGEQNIPIPTTLDGVYLDVETGTTSSSEFVGWDTNPFFGGTAIAGSTTFQPVREGTGNQDSIVTLSLGELVDGTSVYSSGFTGSSDHLGAAQGFTVGQEGYLGFSFTKNDTTGPYYGWMRLTLTANTAGAIIHDWAWEDIVSQPIQVGAIPEPQSLVLLIGAVLLCSMRRARRS